MTETVKGGLTAIVCHYSEIPCYTEQPKWFIRFNPFTKTSDTANKVQAAILVGGIKPRINLIFIRGFILLINELKVIR